MTVVTITSDFGNTNYNLAALKGSILSSCSQDLQLVDISNEIANYNIVEGAFVLSNAYGYFPENSIHILAINTFYSSQHKLLVLHKNGHFFIAPNNGILSLLFENDLPEEIISVSGINDTKSYFHTLGNIIDKISSGIPIENLGIGKYSSEISHKIMLKPVISENTIRGTVIFIDNFGNLITNIKKEQFITVRKEREFGIFFRHKDPITRINKHYHEVSVGAELCIFNIANHLEIAVNMGNANRNLGIQLDDTIQVDFY